MNFFGMGPTELLVVVLIMVVIAGPKRMLQWAYILGKYLTVLRNMWREVMKDIQKEFDEAGVDIKLPQDIPTRSDLTRMAGEAMKPINEPVQQVVKEVEAERKNLQGEARTLNNQLKTDVKPQSSTNGRTSQPVSSGFGTWSGQQKDEG